MSRRLPRRILSVHLSRRSLSLSPHGACAALLLISTMASTTRRRHRTSTPRKKSTPLHRYTRPMSHHRMLPLPLHFMSPTLLVTRRSSPTLLITCGTMREPSSHRHQVLVGPTPPCRRWSHQRAPAPPAPPPHRRHVTLAGVHQLPRRRRSPPSLAMDQVPGTAFRCLRLCHVSCPPCRFLPVFTRLSQMDAAP